MPTSEKLGYNLGMAALNGDKTMVRRLLAAGADLEVQVPVMQNLIIMMTPLHAAIFNNHEIIVKLLLDAGVDVDAKQCTGETPLHCCAMEGQVDILVLLINAGADPMLTAVGGRTPLHVVAEWGNHREARSLQDATAKVNPQGTKGNDPPLLENGKGINATMKHSAEGMAFEAFKARMNEIAQLLLDAGVDPDMPDEKGCSAMSYAITSANDQIVRTMVAAEVNVNCMAQQGVSGVFMTAMMGSASTLDIILEAGASPHLTGGIHPTPVQIAIIQGQPECLALLLAAGGDPTDTYKPAPGAFNARLRERLRGPFHPGGPNSRVSQMLAVSPAFPARSWAWPDAATGRKEGGATTTEERIMGGRTEVDADPDGVLWVSQRRGSVFKGMIRYVAKAMQHRPHTFIWEA